MILNFHEPVHYHVKRNGQKLLLKLIGFDDFLAKQFFYE